ncbi:MAG: EAL domain-containing protein [Actinomycetota bacterium]|nr:EAL domain-containing protein [Actinomycetota bacterium]
MPVSQKRASEADYADQGTVGDAERTSALFAVGAAFPVVEPVDLVGPRVHDLLHDARVALAMPIAFVSTFSDGRRVIEAVDAVCPVPFTEGDSHPAVDTYCQRIVDGDLPQAISDASTHRVTAGMAVTAELGIGSYVGVPILLTDGTVYGTLCAYSDVARPVDDRDSAILTLVARSIAQHLSSDLDERTARAAIRDRLARVLAEQTLQSVYQPIIDITSGTAVALEALARFPELFGRRTDEWFADAARVGGAAMLEVAAIRRAVEGLVELPPHVAVSLNVSAAVVLDPLFAQWLAGAPVERLILELTEHEEISDYEAIIAALASARAGGLRLAVDDFGAGYASMRHTLLLEPDLLKLDISLIRDIDTDRNKRGLCRAVITFAKSLGAQVVAEGVETAAEMQAVRRSASTRLRASIWLARRHWRTSSSAGTRREPTSRTRIPA